MIFLIISKTFQFDWEFCTKCRIMKIYQKIEENGYKKWSKCGNIGHQQIDMFFPPVIKAIEDGKFIFFSQKTKRSSTGFFERLTVSNLLEVWEKNETLSRSLLKFPMNFRQNIEFSTDRIWIIQV